MSSAGERISPAELVDASRVGDVAITPDGSAVFFIRLRPDEDDGELSELWSCSSDGGDPTPVRTGANHVAAFGLDTSGERLAIVASDEDVSRLRVVPLGGAEPREILRLPGSMPGPIATGSNSIRDIVWSPDGSLIAFTAYVWEPGTHRPVYSDVAPHVRVIRSPMYKEDGLGDSPAGTLQVHLVDVATGDVRRLTATAHDHDRPAFSPDGRWVAAHRRDPTNNYRSTVVLYPVEGGDHIVIGSEDGRLDHLAWSPDGGRLAFVGNATGPPSPTREILLFDLATDRLTTLVEDPPAEPLGPLVWLGMNELLVHGLRGANSALFVIGVDRGTTKLIAELGAGHWGMSVDRGGRRLAQTRETPTCFGEVVVVDLGSADVRSIVEPDPVLGEAGVAPPRTLTVASGELTIEAISLKPAGAAPDERLPTIFCLHGGPADAWGGYFTDIAFLLASHGYQAVMPNVRGSIGYGRAFASAQQGDYGGGELADLMAVVDEVSSSDGTDASRLGIIGGSHGGYLTSWAIANTERFAAAVCACPVFDLRSEWGTHDVGPGWGDLYLGGAPWEAPHLYSERSPSFLAHRITTPTLVVHGEADHRCPVGQGEQLFAALHRTGCPSELVLYPGASHGFGEPGFPRRVRTDYFTRLLAWFDTYLRSPTTEDASR
jgi:dipeptidyl aminopeptidase/acylaminoacyl peptidase